MKVFLILASSLNFLAFVSSGKSTRCFSCCHGSSPSSMSLRVPVSGFSPAHRAGDLLRSRVSLYTKKSWALAFISPTLPILFSQMLLPKSFKILHPAELLLSLTICLFFLFIGFLFTGATTLTQYSNAASHSCGITDTDSLYFLCYSFTLY